MWTRCNNSPAENYRRYGGRGITICERWRSFDNFIADMGERSSGLTIDRIDNGGSYEPGNVAGRPLPNNETTRESDVAARFRLSAPP